VKNKDYFIVLKLLLIIQKIMLIKKKLNYLKVISGWVFFSFKCF